jgi:murein tripeptide amidase MpaA
MTFAFDTYYDNDQLAAALAELAAAHPGLLELNRLGQSHEGRDIELAIVTNRATGPHGEKPAFWIDGNIHATELTASMAALYVLRHLLTRYGQDPQVTRVLDEQAVYIVPRLNPDGAAAALAVPPRFVRSGTRAYPYEDRRDGLHAEDIDGDGRILQMRLSDPSGDWKVSERDARLMVKRRPDEEGGQYYRLLPEGRIQNYDGHLIQLAPPLAGLDFNRNFPHAWRPQGEQWGAGDFPGSEPEIQAVLRFLAEHPNVFGALTFHTYSRAILRPYSGKPDEEMETEDLWAYQAIGDRGTELTGYPNVSVYHHFRYHPKEVITGVFDDYLFAQKGIFAFTVELWDLAIAAGIEGKNKDKQFMDWFRKHPIEDDYKVLDFVLAQAPDALVAWRPFDHPELGPVEIGGWDSLYSWRNPPPALLEAEIAPQAAFAVSFASLAPRLAWRDVLVESLGNGSYHVTAVVENTGFLGTSGSKQAQKTQSARPVRLEIALPNGAALASGKPRVELGHLEGRSNKLSPAYYGSSPTDNRAKAEWLVRAPAGGEVTLTAVAERAGTIRRVVRLGA